MHLRDVALVKTGDRVVTGQPLGFVGDTGSASALPPALRDLDRAGLVQRRLADRPAADPEAWR